MVKAIGIFVPIVREVDKMLNQWDVPFVISDRRFRRAVPAAADAGRQAAAATVAWAQQHYATMSRAIAPRCADRRIPCGARTGCPP
jgi:hypothetical protein